MIAAAAQEYRLILRQSQHKVYAMSAVTALTAQNTTGVYGILDASPDFLANQIDCIFNDIRPDAVKTGMVSSKDLIAVIAQKLKEHKAENIVVDPVMVSSSGSKLLADDAIDALKNLLLPIATLVTPNIPEAQVLAQMEIKSEEDMMTAGKIINERYGCSVLIKGGHQLNDANDFLYTHEKQVWFAGERIENPNTHGTGCTLSSAIACNLAKGRSIEDSVKNAKAYISGALKSQLNLGKGSGPLDHMFDLKGFDENEN